MDEPEESIESIRIDVLYPQGSREHHNYLLYLAVIADNTYTIHDYLDNRNANLRIYDKYHQYASLLHYASSSAMSDILVEYGADKNATDSNGKHASDYEWVSDLDISEDENESLENSLTETSEDSNESEPPPLILPPANLTPLLPSFEEIAPLTPQISYIFNKMKKQVPQKHQGEYKMENKKSRPSSSLK